MKMLLRIVWLLFSKPKFTPELQNHTDDFLGNISSVALVTKQFSPWLDLFINVPIVALADTSQSQNIRVGAYFIDMQPKTRVTTFAEILKFPRDANTRFVILTGTSIPDDVMRVDLCHVLIISSTGNVLKVQKEKGTQRVNASFVHFKPAVIIDHNGLSGYEGRLIAETFRYLKLELLLINRQEMGFTDVEKDIISKQSLVGFGTVVPSPDRYEFADMVPTCYPCRVSYIAPLHIGPGTPSWLIVLSSELSIQVWLAILVVYMLVIMIGIFFENVDTTWPLYVFSLMLGVSLPERVKAKINKGLILSIIWFGFLLTAFYVSRLSSMLLAPDKPREITNWDEIVSSGLDLAGASFDRSLSQNSKSLETRYKGRMQLEKALEAVVKDGNLIYSRYESNIKYVAEMDPRYAGKYHIVEEPLLTYLPVVMVQKHSCMTMKIQKYFNRQCANGQTVRWYEDFSMKKKTITQGPTPLAISQIQGFLYCLLIGWAIALLTFIAEIMTDERREVVVVEESGNIQVDVNNEDEDTLEYVIDPTAYELDLNHHRIKNIEGFERLTNIHDFCLRWNLIKKIENLSMLVTLVKLELSDNQITAIENLDELVNLQYLDISYNRITKIEGLTHLTNLKKLFLESNRIQKIENLSHLNQLELLELGDNRIRIIENLDHLTSLRELHLGKNKIREIQNLDKLTNLCLLGLMSNRIIEMKGFHTLLELDQLYLSDNGISTINGLEHNVKITTLDLASNSLTSIENINHLTELTDLWLNGNKIGDWACVERLGSLTNLSTIYLEGNPLSEDTAYRRKLKLMLPCLMQIDATLCH